MIEDLLRRDAESWQHAVDAGARPTRDRRFDWRPLAAAAVVLAVVAGVLLVRRHDTSDPAGVPRALTGERWVDPASSGEVVFTEHTVRVFDTCLDDTYALTVTGDRFTIGAQVGPAIVCAGPVPGPARVLFDQVVTGTVRWQREGASLRLTKGTRSVVLRAERLLTLTGTTWQLVDISDAPNVTTIPAGTTLLIGRDGSIRAKDLCGTITGHATIKGNTVVFRTRSDCLDPGFSPPSRQIDTVLGSTATYWIRGATLAVSVGDRVLTYHAA